MHPILPGREHLKARYCERSTGFIPQSRAGRNSRQLRNEFRAPAKKFVFKRRRSCLTLGMDSLLKLLQENAALRPVQLAALLNMPESEVAAKIKAYEGEQVILGYRAILNEEKLGLEVVRAVIEVKITPERGGGFDRLAERIAKYQEVHSCYLMSGGYDLLVVVEGRNLREVATFVSEKLATIHGVISTATHFMLKPYKEQGVLMHQEAGEERLAVAP